MAFRPRVVIIGAGFGGLAAAHQLRADDVDVTIIDQHNFHTFHPLLYQVATAGLNAADVAYPVRGIIRDHPNTRFRQGAVVGADWDDRAVVLDDGDRIPFDHLILAAGATANFFGIEGADEHSYPLYVLSDAVRLRNHVLRSFERADADPRRIDDGALTFVVVGGGPTGVEVAGALGELVGQVLRRDFRMFDLSQVRVVLLEMLPTLLGTFSDRSQGHALATLCDRGVEVRLGEAVDRVTANRVRLSSGEEIPCHTMIWAAGVQANPLVDALGLPTTKTGRVKVEPDLSLPDRPNVSVIGDIAGITDHRDELLPQLAPVAQQSGRHAARQILRRIDGRPTRPFHYTDKGTMATIGRRAAVAELPLGIKLWGTPAWLAWLGLHLVTLMGFRNRLSVFLNWCWNYLTWDRGPRLILERDDP